MTKTISFFFLVALAFISNSLSAQNLGTFTDANQKVAIQLPANWDSLAYSVKSDIFKDCMESRLVVSTGDLSSGDVADVTVTVEEISNVATKIVNREGLTEEDADYVTPEEEYNKLPDWDSKLVSLEDFSLILYQYDSLYEVVKKEKLNIPNTTGSWIEFKHYRDLGEGKFVLLHGIIVHQIRGNRLLMTEIECREEKWKQYGAMLSNAAKTVKWTAK